MYNLNDLEIWWHEPETYEETDYVDVCEIDYPFEQLYPFLYNILYSYFSYEKVDIDISLSLSDKNIFYSNIFIINVYGNSKYDKWNINIDTTDDNFKHLEKDIKEIIDSYLVMIKLEFLNDLDNKE